MKRILIVGKNSYIGKNIKSWLERFPDKYQVDAISVRNELWKEHDFSIYDTVINLAGIAHINNITPEMKGLFYSVNRDLVGEIGEYAKKQGVRHFVHFSSMNVYGDYCDNVCDREAVNPTSFYGDSKLQGDIKLANLADQSFIVACVRPPFVYGKGCTGNYNIISKIAKKTPVFPDFPNCKSMIYIDNLCEFIRCVVDERIGGYLTPQNKELVSTSDLVKEIATVAENKIVFTKLFNIGIAIGNRVTKQVRRAFADDCYVLSLSDYFNYDYCVVDFKESIRRTEAHED